MRLCVFLVSPIQQCLDLCVRVNDIADGNVVVQRCDEVGNILGAVYFVEPLTLEQFICPVGQIGGEYCINVAVLICLVELLQTVYEQTVSCITDVVIRPLVMRSVAKSETLALSMELKGFGSNTYKNMPREPLGAADFIVLGLVVVLSAYPFWK